MSRHKRFHAGTILLASGLIVAGPIGWAADAASPGQEPAGGASTREECPLPPDLASVTGHVLVRATLADASTTPQGAAAIKANIAELYLKMLGEVATPAEVDDLFTSVFVKYESKGAATAWTAVCAALIRDPLWILY